MLTHTVIQLAERFELIPHIYIEKAFNTSFPNMYCVCCCTIMMIRIGTFSIFSSLLSPEMLLQLNLYVVRLPFRYFNVWDTYN